MKIKIKSTAAFFWINFICWLTVSTLSVQLKAQEIDMVKKGLGAGVNISLLEQYWNSPNTLYQTNINTQLKQIARQGFTTVRLPVNFEIFLQPQSFNLQPQLLEKLNEIYSVCTAKKLNLIISYFYGKLNDNNSNNEIDRISWMWKQIQRNFFGKGYNNLFFEIYNEPTISNNKWKETITTLVQYLRYEDANRIYIIGGTNYNNLDQLKELGKIADDKIFYTFHFYEPFIFTHQGANWTNNKSYLTDLPFPYQKNKMPKLNNAIKSTSLERDYNKYPYEATEAYLNERIRNIANFCRNNNMPLICTETGVINNASKQSRKKYFSTITIAMLANNIPCDLWDYDDKFSIKKNKTKLISSVKSWVKKSKQQ